MAGNEAWQEAMAKANEAASKSTASYTAEPRQAYAMESIAWSLIAQAHADRSGIQPVQLVGQNTIDVRQVQ